MKHTEEPQHPCLLFICNADAFPKDPSRCPLAREAGKLGGQKYND